MFWSFMHGGVFTVMAKIHVPETYSSSTIIYITACNCICTVTLTCTCTHI